MFERPSRTEVVARSKISSFRWLARSSSTRNDSKISQGSADPNIFPPLIYIFRVEQILVLDRTRTESSHLKTFVLLVALGAKVGSVELGGFVSGVSFGCSSFLNDWRFNDREMVYSVD